MDGWKKFVDSPANAAMNAAVTGLTDAVTTMGQSVTFNGYAGTLDLAYAALKAATQ